MSTDRAGDVATGERHYAAECWCGWWRETDTFAEASTAATVHTNEMSHTETGVETWTS